jgi:hypothetical protein
MNQHQAHTQTVQEHKVMDDVTEVRVCDPVARQHDDKGAIAVGMDVGRRVAKPVYVIGHIRESL